MWGALSDERMGLSFTIAAGPHQRIILGPEFSAIHDHILLSQIRGFPTWRARHPYLYPPGTGWPSYTSRHRVPSSSPPSTRRATVDVYEPASTPAALSPSLSLKAPARTAQKNLFHYCVFFRCRGNNVSTELFPNNKKFGEELITYFPSICHGPHRKRRVRNNCSTVDFVFVAKV
jgi:hypothetical protein